MSETFTTPMIFITRKGLAFGRLGPPLPDDLLVSGSGKIRVPIEGDTVVSVIQAVRFFPECVVIAASRRGVISAISLAAFRRVGGHPRPALRLNAGDEVVEVVVADADSELVVGTERGCLHLANVRDVLLSPRQELPLRASDPVVSVLVGPSSGEFLSVFDDGTGQRRRVRDVAGAHGDEHPAGPVLSMLHPIVAGMQVQIASDGDTVLVDPFALPINHTVPLGSKVQPIRATTNVRCCFPD